MKRAGKFLTTSAMGIFLFLLTRSELYPMVRLYFEKEDNLVVKLLVLIIGMIVGILITAKIIYPQLIESDMNPFKARNIFNATIYSFLVLFYGITLHTLLDILYVSIALGVVMIIWMLVAVIKD
ncbi:MAG: hypothetical protein JSV88_31595 [Candidatus Aminicenantes bacterium]|nr:MAG: hypothetical protein JSV88_31595 [Candidatus Aminicenantes bacterium]